MITRFATISSRLTAYIAFLFVLTACGGGGGGGGGFLPDDGSDDQTYFLSLTLRNTGGETITEVTSASPATLSVKVTQKNPGGAAVPEVVVSAETEPGVLSPATSLTDSNGVATFELEAGDTLGAGVITASATSEDGVVTQETLNYQVAAAGLRLGHFSDGVFIENEIGVLPNSAIAFQGAAELVIDIVDQEGNRVDSQEFITIRSDCLATGAATLNPESPVESATGSVRATYTSIDCSGADDLTASIESGDGTAFETLSIGSPEARSLTFTNAEPDLIVLKGTGGGPNRQETSIVSFTVTDANNEPLSNISVDFSLSTTVGGLSLTRLSDVSDAEGLVETTLISGDVATPVRVIASITSGDGSNTTLSTVSDILTVSTGLPDQNSISLSVSNSFIVENGFTKDGVERCITVRMADKFNNPVPDGTSAIFTTEYGTIDPSCVTGIRQGERAQDTSTCPSGPPIEGQCSVLWTSGEPRQPTLSNNINDTRRINDSRYDCPDHNGTEGPCPSDLGPVRGGRSTILVTAIGEESFIDRNGNGLVDQSERDLFANLPEAFIDHNEDGVFNPDSPSCTNSNSTACVSGFEETFVDFNNDGLYNRNDTPAIYNGLLCPKEGDGVWCSRDLLNVFSWTVVTLSAGDAYGWDFLLTRNGSIQDDTEEGREYTVYISDIYNNAPPGGSTISVTASGGCVVLNPTQQIEVPNIGRPGAFGFTVTTDGDGTQGTVQFTLEPVDDSSAPYTESFDCQSIAPPDPDSP